MNPLASHIHTVVAHYGLGQVQAITPLQPGFVAHAHRVQTTTHDVMVKTYDRTRAITARMLEYAPFYLQVTAYLATQTPVQDRIVAPTACPDGTVLYDDTQFVSVVFAYIEGITPRTNPLTIAQQCDMATTIGMIHRVSAQVPLPTHARIETFVPRWDAVWATMLGDEWHLLPPEIQTMLAPSRPALMTLQQRMRHVGAYLRAHPLPMVLCHSDIHGWNVIVRDERTWLIDFEGLVLAPAEQDLFCWYSDDVWPAVFATYQQVVGGHTLHPQAMYFYQVKRFLEDIYEWVAELCDVHLSPTLRQEYMALLQDNLTYCAHMCNKTGHTV